MPMKRERYPADWEEISRRVKDRAGWKCEWPGCGAPHGAWIARRIARPDEWVDRTGAIVAEIEEFGPIRDPSILKPVGRGLRRPIKVVITSAHICGCDPICGNDRHIVALCPRHHLIFDTRERTIAVGAFRRARDAQAGQRFLFGDIDTPPARTS